MSDRTMEERMATVEAEVSQTKALAEKIDQKLDRWRDEHFTKEEVREMMRSRDKEFEELKAAFNTHLTSEQTNRQTNKMNAFQWALVIFAGVSSIGSIGVVIVSIATHHP